MGIFVPRWDGSLKYDKGMISGRGDFEGIDGEDISADAGGIAGDDALKFEIDADEIDDEGIDDEEIDEIDGDEIDGEKERKGSSGKRFSA